MFDSSSQNDPAKTSTAADVGVFRAILTIRLVNAFVVTTFFQPDEFFQSLEPAWQLAFGPDSGAWITWEWHHQLRSSIHPLIFAGAYKAADYLGAILPMALTTRTALLVATPRIVQAVFASLGDYYTWRLARKIHPDRPVALSALLLQLLSAWQWFTSIRTFSNSLETTLTAMALSYYPWHLVAPKPSITADSLKTASGYSVPAINITSLRACLVLAALAVVLRPTNLLIWATIAGVTLTRVGLPGESPLSGWDIFVFLREVVICGSAVLGLSALADSRFFGFWTFPPWNWLNFNLNQDLAVFYGRNPWHYYLLQGIPLLTTASLPLVLLALVKPASQAKTPGQANAQRVLAAAVYVTTLSLSLISHKEVRFISPLLPLLNVLAAPHATSLLTSTPTPFIPSPERRHRVYFRLALGLNVLLAGFLSFAHQPAPLTVLSHLRTQHELIHSGRATDELFALFIMPCHSTPWRSHLVHPFLHARALTCEPPLHTSPHTLERLNYRDEADRFYDAPQSFLSGELFLPGTQLPRYIVGFEGVEPLLEEFLRSPQGRETGMSLVREWEAFNGFFNEDWRRTGKVVVWETGVYDEPPDDLVLKAKSM